MDLCRQLIYDSLSDGAIEELVFNNRVVVDWLWILHHFEFESFRLFGFLDDLLFNLRVLETLPLGVNKLHQTSKGHFIQDTYKNMV